MAAAASGIELLAGAPRADGARLQMTGEHAIIPRRLSAPEGRERALHPSAAPMQAAPEAVDTHGGHADMLARNHVTRRPVRQAVKITRSALNHALDVAEPRLEKAAGDLEDLTREILASLRKSSLERLDDYRALQVYRKPP